MLLGLVQDCRFGICALSGILAGDRGKMSAAFLEARVCTAEESGKNRREQTVSPTAPKPFLGYKKELKCVFYGLDNFWKMIAG